MFWLALEQDGLPENICSGMRWLRELPFCFLVDLEMRCREELSNLPLKCDPFCFILLTCPFHASWMSMVPLPIFNLHLFSLRLHALHHYVVFLPEQPSSYYSKLCYSTYSPITGLLFLLLIKKASRSHLWPIILFMLNPPLCKYHPLPQTPYPKLYPAHASYLIYCWHRIKVSNTETQCPCLDSAWYFAFDQKFPASLWHASSMLKTRNHNICGQV